jgi:hypothetical protein
MAVSTSTKAQQFMIIVSKFANNLVAACVGDDSKDGLAMAALVDQAFKNFTGLLVAKQLVPEPVAVLLRDSAPGSPVYKFRSDCADLLRQLIVIGATVFASDLDVSVGVPAGLLQDFDQGVAPAGAGGAGIAPSSLAISDDTTDDDVDAETIRQATRIRLFASGRFARGSCRVEVLGEAEGSSGRGSTCPSRRYL